MNMNPGAMPKENPPMSAANSPEAVLASVLCLMHRYAVCSGEQEDLPRLSLRIQCQLEQLAASADLPALLRHTCDDLAEAWPIAPGRRFS